MTADQFLQILESLTTVDGWLICVFSVLCLIFLVDLIRLLFMLHAKFKPFFHDDVDERQDY